HQRAIDLFQALVEADPTNVECRYELAIADLNAAFWKLRDGHLQAAEDLLLNALALWQTAANRPGASRQDRLGLARTHHSLGMLCHAAGRGREAREHLHEARLRLESLVAEDPANADYGEARA